VSKIIYEDVVVQTESQEKYTCKIPQFVEKEKDENEKYTGPNPLELLSDLFTQSSCSYKVNERNQKIKRYCDGRKDQVEFMKRPNDKEQRLDCR